MSLPADTHHFEPKSGVRRYWLLGGSGAVGQNLIGILAQVPNVEVVVVSRKPKIGLGSAQNVETRACDLANPKPFNDIRPEDRIVNLTEATPPVLAAQAVRAGGIFIETSASSAYVESLRAVAVASRGLGLLIDCVGVAPGLTNLMAHDLIAQGDTPKSVEIGIELGLGKHAGLAATAWTIASLGRNYTAKRKHKLEWLSPGQVSTDFRFGQDDHSRRAVGFPFADQEILAANLPEGIATILTYLAIDPPIMTHVLWMSMHLGLGKVMAGRAHDVARTFLRLPTVGRASTRLTVQSRTADGEISSLLHLSTGDQSAATAAVAATAATQDLASVSGKGPVLSISDVLSLDLAVQRVTLVHPETSLDRQYPLTSRLLADRQKMKAKQ